ncbi:MAG: hypothetical protein M3O32_00270 [Actinomycetota bacterium]|nr:hypothetical protein [Actinomycetota bacterium]
MTLAEDLTAYGTLALAAVGAVQTYVTRQAVRTTREDVRESRRARIDASAPRVTFVCRATSWPPHLVDYHDITARIDMNPEHRFVLPRDDEQVIYVAAAIDLTNESQATAIVTLPEDVAVIGPGGAIEPGRDGDTAFSLRDTQTVTLAPQQRLNIWVRASRRAGEWAALGVAAIEDREPLCRVITVEDTLADGVRDETTIELRAVPIVPSGRDDHAWVLNAMLPGHPVSTSVKAVAAPTVRIYRGETVPSRRWWQRA